MHCPEAMRQRFLAIGDAADDREVAPLVQQVVGDRAYSSIMMAVAAVALACVLLLLVVAMIGFGDLESSDRGSGMAIWFGAVYIDLCHSVLPIAFLLALRRAGAKSAACLTRRASISLCFFAGRSQADSTLEALYDLTQASGNQMSRLCATAKGASRAHASCFSLPTARSPTLSRRDFDSSQGTPARNWRGARTLVQAGCCLRAMTGDAVSAMIRSMNCASASSEPSER